MSTATMSNPHKSSGDISAVFPSLSGRKPEPLPDRFKDLKLQRIRGKEDPLKKSWHRLLASLKDEIADIKARGSAVSMISRRPNFDLLLTVKGDTSRRLLRSRFRSGQTERAR